MDAKPKGKKTFGGRIRGASICPMCQCHYIGEPELKKNETSGVRWLVYTHPGNFCRRFLGAPKKESAA